MGILDRVPLDALRRFAAADNFDCLPRRYQVLEFVRFLIAQGVSRFSAGDVAELFRAVEVASPRSGRPIRCSPAEAAGHVAALIVGGLVAVRPLSAEEFEA